MSLTQIPECSVAGCDRRRRSRGWCAAHYNQWYTTQVEPTRPFSDDARFYRYVQKDAPRGCWLWIGTVKKTGYGQFWFDGKPRSAHRHSYKLSKGAIPAGMLIRHACDVKRCVNPEHLLLGTPLDNARDAVERNLYPRGETQGRAKLTAAQVTEIRFLNAGGESQKSLAHRFGVSTSAVSFIMTGHTWSGIGDKP